MVQGVNLKSVPHLAFQSDKTVVLSEVDALLLRRISETNSLTKAAKLLGVSYRNAWGRIRKIESSLGKKILETRTGGLTGGSSRLTPDGLSLFREFRSTRKYLFNALDDRESAGNIRYKLSARNRVGAKITEIERGDITSLIRMRATAPITLTSIISNDAVDDLRLQKGDEVEAVIKSTEVMVGKRLPSSDSRKTKPRG
jgi:molybdate transport system regulatory protein